MAARELANRAFTDPLTGLPNRVRLLDRLAMRSIAGPARRPATAGRRSMAMVCDIDQFKPLNTVVGADGRRRRAARGGRPPARPSSSAPVTLARLGGDSFVVVIAGPADVMAAMRLANRIRSAVGAPISLDGRQVELSLSVGIAEGVVGDDPERLIRRAEQAMARASHDGGDRTELFDGALAEESTRRHTIDQQLRNALDHDGLRVHFQPIIDIETDQVVAAEALLRVHDDDGTVLSPAEFIEAAESSGLISQLGLQVLQATCEQLAVWSSRARGRRPGEVSVNVSPRQLADPDLPAQVQQVLAATGVDPAQPEPGDHREHPDRGRADRRRRHLLPAVAGGAHRARRLRHRPVLARLPQALPARLRQDRPVAGGRPRHRRAGHRHRAGHHRAGPQPGAGRHRGRRRERGAARGARASSAATGPRATCSPRPCPPTSWRCGR